MSRKRAREPALEKLVFLGLLERQAELERCPLRKRAAKELAAVRSLIGRLETSPIWSAFAEWEQGASAAKGRKNS
jgi:hypothetical protein